MTQPDVWLRGPLPDLHESLQPLAHALLQVEEDILPVLQQLTAQDLWSRPGMSAPIGYHVVHLAGSLDRLFTYANDKALSDNQRRALAYEKTVANDQPSAQEMATRLKSTIAAALKQLANTPPETLFDRREVGRARLPSNVIGLLFHGAEHSTRHAGQVLTLARVLSGPLAK